VSSVDASAAFPRRASNVRLRSPGNSFPVENGSRWRELVRRNAELEWSSAQIDRLIDVSAGSVDLVGLLRDISDVMGVHVTLESNQAAEAQADDAITVVVGTGPAGTLRAAAREPLQPGERRVLEHAARLVAIHLQQATAAIRPDELAKSELIERLMASDQPPDERLTHQLLRVGLDLSAAHRVVVIRSDSGRILDAARCAALVRVSHGERQLPGTVVFVEFRSQVACFIPESVDKHTAWLVEAIRRAGSFAGDRASAGLSGVHAQAAAALREAEACAFLACQASDPAATIRADRLGALRFVLALPDLHGVRSMVGDQLGRLVTHDRDRKASLTDTLRAFLDLGGNHAAMAERCHIHVSTVKYRMKRITELLEREPGDPQVRFDLMLAFKAADLFAMIGENLVRCETPPSKR
jgi:sugar diacid utilization regulator